MPAEHGVVCPEKEQSFFHPIENRCVPCAEVCNSDRRNLYCNNNCHGCPKGSFLHPIIEECVSCSALCGGEQGTEANQEYCRRQCSDVLHGCKKTEQFYHPIEKKCVDCSRACSNKKTLFCRKNCARVIVLLLIHRRHKTKYSKTKNGQLIATATQGQIDTSSEDVEGRGQDEQDGNTPRQSLLSSSSAEELTLDSHDHIQTIQGVSDSGYQGLPSHLGINIRNPPTDASRGSNDVIDAEVRIPVPVCSQSQTILYSFTGPNNEIPHCTQQTNRKVPH